MRKLLRQHSIFTTLCCILFVSNSVLALNYTISFTGSGGSNTVDSVIVQNLTKGTSTTVLAGNVLNLSDVITPIDLPTSEICGLRIFPNPIKENASFSYYAKHDGQTAITVHSIDGTKILNLNPSLHEGINTFQLTLPKGVYLLKARGVGYNYDKKIISIASSFIKPSMTFASHTNRPVTTALRNANSVTTMLYNADDQLLYKGISGNYTTIVTDKPISNKTTNFEFIECKDADGNYYPVVRIGGQLWMAENLRTTKYRNDESINYFTDYRLWPTKIGSWCDYNHSSFNGKSFGHLYNWYAVNDRRDISPIGWHVPSDAEWTVLSETYGGFSNASGKLKDNSLNFWDLPNINATNISGFTAIGGGLRNGDNGPLSNFGTFNNIKLECYLWTSNIYPANEMHLGQAFYLNTMDNANGLVIPYKSCGCSVRCIKN